VDNPKSSRSSPDARVSTQLLPAQCGDRPHHHGVQEDSNAVHAIGKRRSGHVKLPPRSAAARVMSQGCSRDSLLECVNPPEVSRYLLLVAERLHFAILTALVQK